jgi:hypothetical protein
VILAPLRETFSHIQDANKLKYSITVICFAQRREVYAKAQNPVLRPFLLGRLLCRLNYLLTETIIGLLDHQRESTLYVLKESHRNLIHLRLFIFLSAAFFIAVIVGTVSHEAGHYIVARLLGYKATIGYAYTEWYGSPTYKDELLLLLGGPFETFLVGAVGLSILYFTRQSYHYVQKLSTGQWTVVLLSLFWLRQPVNLATWIIGFFLNGKFSHQGDEIKLARLLLLPDWAILVVSAIISLVAFYWIMKKFIPGNARFTFLLSGFIGGIAGYTVWLFILGPVLMP